MAQYLYYLPNFFVATDDWRQLVLPSELVQAHSEVLQIRRKLVTTSVFFFLLFMTADPRCDFLHDYFAVRTQPSKQFDRIAVRIGEQSIEKIGRLDKSAALLARMFKRVGQQRPERLGNLHPPAEVIALIQFCFERLNNNLRIKVEALHDLVKEGSLNFGDGNEKVFRRKLIVIASPGLFVGFP